MICTGIASHEHLQELWHLALGQRTRAAQKDHVR